MANLAFSPDTTHFTYGRKSSPNGIRKHWCPFTSLRPSVSCTVYAVVNWLLKWHFRSVWSWIWYPNIYLNSDILLYHFWCTAYKFGRKAGWNWAVNFCCILWLTYLLSIYSYSNLLNGLKILEKIRDLCGDWEVNGKWPEVNGKWQETTWSEHSKPEMTRRKPEVKGKGKIDVFCKEFFADLNKFYYFFQITEKE